MQAVSVAQVPPVQVWPAAQALPQAPQFMALVSTSMQVPAQRAWPVGQGISIVHVPPAQVCVPVHGVPQAPQLALSVIVSTHVLPHSV